MATEAKQKKKRSIIRLIIEIVTVIGSFIAGGQL